MNNKTKIIALPLAIFSASVFSADVNVSRVTDSESVATTLLNDTVDRIVDSYGQAYIDIVSPANFKKSDVERGVQRVGSKSIARFEYHYTMPNGERATRIYHSFSGETPTPGLQGHNVDFTQKIEAEMRANERLVTGKITEEEYHSGGRYFRASSYARANDAEIKAMRKIEKDILSGDLESGGSLTVFVNQLPCESCTPLFEEQLAAWPHIATADVSYLGQIPENFNDLENNSWYQYMSENDGLALGEEAQLQVSFTAHRKERIKFNLFKKRVLSRNEIRNGAKPTSACSL
ncbi:hypothetical protein KIV40_16305 [Vibrio sp. D173a]|uniref:hypothetical protein n=1 Tax=Vibrio sp. D173a TaxID=2836349 RepID=UPI0025579B19|nr:hypothetical protein [Vibrio sp. D173a]MDK9756925.1 hypothetical protein [Vibrio sp. D173a]